VNQIIKDKQQNIWIATTDGVLKYDPTRKQIRVINDQEPFDLKLPFTKAWGAFIDEKKHLWIGGNELNNGLVEVDLLNKKMTRYLFEQTQTKAPLWKLAGDGKNNIWAYRTAVRLNEGNDIYKKNVNESIFWAKELYDSEEFDCITEVLFVSWFYSIGIGNIEVLRKILTTNIQDENEIYNLVYGMTVLKESMRDCTLPVMFIYGISNPKYKNRNIHFQLPVNLQQLNPKVDAFIRAVLLGKFLESWLLYQTTNVSSSIDKLVEVKIKDTNLRDIVSCLQGADINETYKMCAMIGILCSKEDLLLSASGCIKNIDSEGILVAESTSALSMSSSSIFSATIRERFPL
jgi:hypothetical protein